MVPTETYERTGFFGEVIFTMGISLMEMKYKVCVWRG
jgi:predicted GH43/DUF377 family glycosyl hydrolase